MTPDTLYIYCDGGARGNPGPAASAFVVIDRGKAVYKKSKYLGDSTNNAAEYQAVVMALSWLTEAVLLKTDEVVLYVDSELVAKQLAGRYKTKSQNLKPLINKARNLRQKIDARISFHSIPRSKNRLADYLVNKELDRRL